MFEISVWAVLLIGGLCLAGSVIGLIVRPHVVSRNWLAYIADRLGGRVGPDRTIMFQHSGREVTLRLRLNQDQDTGMPSPHLPDFFSIQLQTKVRSSLTLLLAEGWSPKQSASRRIIYAGPTPAGLTDIPKPDAWPESLQSLRIYANDENSARCFLADQEIVKALTDAPEFSIHIGDGFLTLLASSSLSQEPNFIDPALRMLHLLVNKLEKL